MTDTEELKQKFWNALADSPFLFLQLDADPHGAVPMTAQLDKHAERAIWFFTSRDHAFAAGGQATATYASRHHRIFARFSGVLSPEPSRERLDKAWSKPLEAWFAGGKHDPRLVMLRMDLTGNAEIWNSDLGIISETKMLFGFDGREKAAEEHTETRL